MLCLLFIEIDECSSSPCVNDGICYDQVAMFDCMCPSQWTGSQCETGMALFVIGCQYNLSWALTILLK